MSVSDFIIIMSIIKSVSRASRDSIPVFLLRILYYRVEGRGVLRIVVD